MRTTSVFRSGNSQAVRIPADLAFHGDRVSVEAVGDAIILRAIPSTTAELLAALPAARDFPWYDDTWDQAPTDEVEAW